MSLTESYILNEQVSFIQHYLPGLDAGEYQLQVEQQVLDSTGNAVSGEAYSNSYTFAVTGDRFSISKPGQMLSSVFPPDNASGEYSNVLPHVVFLQNTFPWIRYPTNTLPYTAPAAGEDTDADVPTWLWVMLLDEDDVTDCADDGLTLNLTPVTRTVADLFPQDALPDGYTSSLGSNYSYFNGATNTDGLEPGQNLSDSIQTIDVPLSLIWNIAPTTDDLQQMAHGRVVSLINQNTTSGASDPGEPTGTYSIVFGNRLPANLKKTVAFLVSLEQLQDFLPDAEGGGAPSGNTYNGDLSLRLAVLTSWSFYSTGQPASFVNQLLTLNGRSSGDTEPASNTNLRVAYTGDNEVVQGALNMGYVPLNETLRTGGQTVTWYRGPLTPYLIDEDWISTPIASPDAAMIFDPTTGMLDVSYASAWSIGRFVALQDTAFSTAWYTWKQELASQVQSSVENELFEQSMGTALDKVAALREMKLPAGAATPLGARGLLRRTLLALHSAQQK